jgi:hypothetical protein
MDEYQAQSNGQPSGVPMMTAEQIEAHEFNKRAALIELEVKKAHTLMGALAIGGDNVTPLFTAKQRKEVEDLLMTALKATANG